MMPDAKTLLERAIAFERECKARYDAHEPPDQRYHVLGMSDAIAEQVIILIENYVENEYYHGMSPLGRPPKACSHGVVPAYTCLTCRKDYQDAYRRTITSSRLRQYRLKYRFGLTPDQVVQMLESQQNRCKLCGNLLDLKTMVIDHDHACCAGRRSCGKCIRGILCISCNAMLGQIERMVKIGIEKIKGYLGTSYAGTL